MAHINEAEPVYQVQIDIAEGRLLGLLGLPANGAQAVVIFAHGSGSGRLSPRNQYVAEVLRGGGLATLLFDLLTPEEEQVDNFTRHLRFDVALLAGRLVTATEWVSQYNATRGLPLGYFGASTGAAAALIAAARLGGAISGVVSRGGRPDLAGPALSEVEAPTLLLVGEFDEEVIQLNEAALRQMTKARSRKLIVVPGASHLFEETGTLEQAAALARQWFTMTLGGHASGFKTSVREQPEAGS